MTPGEHPELEYLRIEVHRLKVQVQSLRSVLVINTNLTADLMTLLGETDSEQRSRAMLRVGDATDEINRLLSGPTFEGDEPAKSDGP